MNQRVLFVDDEPETLRLVSMLLKREGFEIFTAANGVEALAIAERILPDAIILDLVMPHQDGFETARQLKESEKCGSLPILIFTGKPAPLTPGPRHYDDYLTKPVHPTELVTRIKALISKAKKSRKKTSENSVIGFISVDNGYSASVIALNTSIMLSRMQNTPLTLLELKPGNGSLHIDLGLNNFSSIEEILNLESSQITPALLQEIQVKSNYGINMLLSRSDLATDQALDEQMNCSGLVDAAQKLAPVTVVDFGLNLSDQYKQLFQYVHEFYVCVKPNPLIVHKSRQLLDYFSKREELRGKNSHVVLYNHGWNEGLFPQHKILDQLNSELACVIPASPNLTLQSSLTHTPITVAYPNSEIAQAFGKLAGHIREQIS